MELTKFWLVWNPAGNSPRVRHPSKEAAMTEARRLSLVCAGQQFIVLKAVGGHVAQLIEPERIHLVDAEASDIPF